MSGDEPDWLVRSQRRRTYAAVAFVALVAAGGIAFWLWPTGAKDLAAAHERIEAKREQYCAVWRQLHNASDFRDDLHGSGERLVLAGFVDLSRGDLSSPLEGANTDAIEMSRLTSLCGEEFESGRGIFRSLFARLAVDPQSSTARQYGREGVALGLSIMENLEYLVVLDVDSHLASRASGPDSLDPGFLRGRVHVFRLAQAQAMGSIPVSLEAPSSAVVYTRNDAYGQPVQEDVDFGVRAESAEYFRSTIANRVSQMGMTLTVDR